MKPENYQPQKVKEKSKSVAEKQYEKIIIKIGNLWNIIETEDLLKELINVCN